METDRTVIVHLAGDEDSDVEEVARLCDYLRGELLALDVDDVEHVRTAVAAGAKGTGLEWAQLAVTLAGTAAPLIGALRGWLRRHRECSLTIEIDGDRLTLSGAELIEQSRLTNAWLRGHGIG